MFKYSILIAVIVTATRASIETEKRLALSVEYREYWNELHDQFPNVQGSNGGFVLLLPKSEERLLATMHAKFAEIRLYLWARACSEQFIRDAELADTASDQNLNDKIHNCDNVADVLAWHIEALPAKYFYPGANLNLKLPSQIASLQAGFTDNINAVVFGLCNLQSDLLRLHRQFKKIRNNTPYKSALATIKGYDVELPDEEFHLHLWNTIFSEFGYLFVGITNYFEAFLKTERKYGHFSELIPPIDEAREMYEFMEQIDDLKEGYENLNRVIDIEENLYTLGDSKHAVNNVFQKWKVCENNENNRSEYEFMFYDENCSGKMLFYFMKAFHTTDFKRRKVPKITYRSLDGARRCFENLEKFRQMRVPAVTPMNGAEEFRISLIWRT